ncbi:diadenylate cyclase [Hymenobacter latericus]|uniref:diadenylate cyclase n=1 Tax=Hymenobacter sp. YIM 151858-1 TaxID=2987688 RepID=UPI00222774E0|nr:diadenylate cyclase [Hymenobacter sp. YIM 151858-1]UYZ59890.1 diadenylate cyclase [Hymenobacter sp. YIM 151858-1]
MPHVGGRAAASLLYYLLMWEYQSLFRVSAQLFAEGIFNLLDRTLRPDVFLVGLAVSRGSESPDAVRLEAGSHDYTSADFAHVKERANSLEREGTYEPVYHLYHEEQDRLEKQRWYLLLRRAVELELESKATGLGRRVFCSMPVLLNGYLIMAVLQLSAEPFASYYALPANPKTPDARPVSLLHAVVREFLLDCSKALRGTDLDQEEDRPILDRDYNELLRAAGRRFMHAPSSGNHGLYDACNGVAALRHEGIEGKGTMLIARRNHPAVVPVLTLETPVPLRDHRSVRKLLEMSEGRTSLISDGTQVFGLGHLAEPADEQYEPLFMVRFTTHHNWELSHDKELMMRVVSGTPRLPQARINEQFFAATIQRLWPALDASTVENLWELTMKATTQRTGTILVISENAAAEAKRLTRQSFRVAPRFITPSVLCLVTNIDGAVLIDPQGTCFAIGAILDGLATEKGDSSRGSRYNSAVRYVESARYPTLAVVVSEDGWIDLLSSKK